MIRVEATRAACIAGAVAAVRQLRLKIESQFGDLVPSFQTERISGVIAMTALSCNEGLAPLQAFASTVLEELAADGDDRWPEEVKEYLQFSLPLDAGGEIFVDVLDHRWTGDLLVRMGCGFNAETIERCLNAARQRERF